MNKWKVAFFLLAGAVLFTVVFIVYMATSKVEERAIPEQEQATGHVLTVQTTAKEFEAIAKKYMGKGPLGKSPIPVEMEVNEQVQLFSELIVFGITVPISMDFEPIVSDGNIRLKQTEVNVGKLNIPPSTVLKLMKDAIEFPDWMIVRPNEEEIYVDLSRINIASGSRVRAKEIDLANDKILLDIIIPAEEVK
ncbi:YpmS family protein [Metasolibacillus sp.]|uniref:YpmS family protein n=1 Tax=Metasolibacillus sp. TaxID=2703680 RepID=UPI0025E6EE77|nr:YpmS family protein [Metasolibacillus sp.]MCT6925931.1 YpmS family protein [Metasolibacillus sp.]MCT6942148.1 YpmS family protein [Metasolibacillus sp.]